MTDQKIIRHKLSDRIFHWVMALCMLVLLGTGLLPVLGVDFAWIVPHWVSGLILTAIILIHIVRSVIWKSLRLIWFTKSDFGKQLPGKYSLEQKLMHHGVAVFCLLAIGTGLLMLVKIDMPFWERDPYWLPAATWGLIYVLHGLAALVFVSITMLHIYFALRPEKAMYLRAMIRGWISKKEFEENHNPEIWKQDEA